MNYLISLGFLILFVGCNNQTVNKEKIKIEPKINTISMLISRCGGGRESIVLTGQKINIPDSLSDEMYLFEIDSTGKMNISFGYGVLEEVNIEMNSVENKETILLPESKNKFIQQLAKNIYVKNEYATSIRAYDTWFVKLTINNKINTYYIGESGNEAHNRLVKSYRDIVDKIVAESPMKVKEYR